MEAERDRSLLREPEVHLDRAEGLHRARRTELAFDLPELSFAEALSIDGHLRGVVAGKANDRSAVGPSTAVTVTLDLELRALARALGVEGLGLGVRVEPLGDVDH